MAERTCIVTGQTDQSTSLLKFVLSPDNRLTPDLAEKLPGRGAYVTSDPKNVAEAIKKNRFQRHIGYGESGTPTDVDKIVSSLEVLLQNRFVEQLALGRRQGLAIAGSGKLKDLANVAGLLIASDASPREARQLENSVKPKWVIRDVPPEAMGRAFSRGAIAYVGILEQNRKSGHKIDDIIKCSFLRWKPFIDAISCQSGTDGCINEQSAIIG